MLDDALQIILYILSLPSQDFHVKQSQKATFLISTNFIAKIKWIWHQAKPILAISKPSNPRGMLSAMSPIYQ